MTAGKRADVAGGLAFLMLVAWGAHVAANPDPSQLVTVGAAAHLLSLCMLLSEARRTRSLPQVSAACLLMLAIGLALRLCSTTYFQGYLPIDATGDGPFQVLEGIALLCAMRGLALYEAAGESPEWRAVLLACTLCAGAAGSCFGDLDRNPTFDGLWAMSVYVETVACVAITCQLKALVERREGLPLGFVLPQLLGFACRASFWHAAYAEIAPENPIRLQEYFPQVLLGVHLLMIASYAGLLLAAFMTHGTPPAPAPAPVPAPAPAVVEPKVAQVAQAGAADLATVMLGELKIAVPPGCSQLVPLSAVYTAEGTLRVTYKPA